MIDQYFLPLFVIPIAAVAVASLGVKIRAVLYPKTWHLRRLRPFDCAFCLAFWVSIGIQPWGATPFVELILVAFASAVIAGKIEKL